MKRLSLGLTIGLILLQSLFACGQSREISYPLPPAPNVEQFQITADDITVEGDLNGFKVEKQLKTLEEDVKLITLIFSADSLSELLPVKLGFKFPSISINGYWNPKIAVDKVNYYYSDISSKASRYAPVLCFYDNMLNNRITFALSDALNRSDITCYLKEEDVHFYPEIELFKERMPKTKFYSISIRIDTRPIPYYKSVDAVAQWWANQPEYKPLSVPEAAKEPMYSTWYSYHQNISIDEIVAECKIAKKLGCGAVIVDDGWQTNDGNRGYAYTGDWTPERIGDMKKFVDLVHEQDMKFLLWYSLPFMGEKAQHFNEFKGKYLRYWESQGTYVMDPRYPEVREYIINTYVTALQNWNLDGFKLDFIGWFTATDTTQLTTENGRDYASVNAATDALMTEITEKLTEIKPDILIEFRQPYIGPIMRKYGNMFRGVDAPNNAVANRIEVTNLRIMAQETAVHSDMFIWRNEEATETAALQILNILYSVPQLSVKLNEIPKKHLEMITFWFDYWNNNKQILLEESFVPSNPGANYPQLTAYSNEKQITTVYENQMVTLEHSVQELDVINAKGNTAIYLDLKEKWEGNLTLFDCSGNVIHKKKVALNPGIHDFYVPLSGLLNLSR